MTIPIGRLVAGQQQADAGREGWAEKHEAPAVSGHAPPKRDRYAGRVLDVRVMLAAPDEAIPWRCDGLVADGFLTVLAGVGGEGKSWLALALAAGVARGAAAAGIDCAQGRAVIFDAENGPKLIGRRLRAAALTPGLAVQPIDAGGLSFAKDLGWFRQTTIDKKANLVVFDSLRVLSSGAKESDADEMEPIVTRLKQLSRDTGAGVLLVHHRGKAETSEYRGSSVIRDQTDLLFTLGRVAGDPEGRHRRKITAVKCRIDEEPQPRWVAIEADRSRGLVFVNATDPYEPDGSGTPGRDALRDDVLGALTDASQSQARIATTLGRAKSDGTVRRLLADLEADGLAEERPAGWGLPTPAPQGVGNSGNPPENPANTASQGLPRALAPLPAGGLDDSPPEQADGDPVTDAQRDALCHCARPIPVADLHADELRCARVGDMG